MFVCLCRIITGVFVYGNTMQPCSMTLLLRKRYVMLNTNMMSDVFHSYHLGIRTRTNIYTESAASMGIGHDIDCDVCTAVQRLT